MTHGDHSGNYLLGKQSISVGEGIRTTNEEIIAQAELC